jgi:hypothetical protein
VIIHCSQRQRLLLKVLPQRLLNLPHERVPVSAISKVVISVVADAPEQVRHRLT